MTTTAQRPSLALHGRTRRFAAAAALAAGLSIPVTGAGSAVAAGHGPSLASTIAVTGALTAPISMGRNDV
ncbi:hypothetical protein [Nostocoides sp. HKS02]|uniref:hypothetical protein n=1 Tax=Nostocoides sp. HKS02 TaxID=1813880 RepID=UPI0012B4C131|nr:hypothetical protein [Tetrasphaera sp. HKS02]QGN58182.1 hypothetical protein GKE56_10105 [Tetrasphaera sp. HKS02]